MSGAIDQVRYVVVLAGTMVIFMNNLAAFRYYLDEKDDLFGLVNESLLLLTTFVAVYISVSSPFHESDLVSYETLFSVYAYLATSPTVTDPDLLFSVPDTSDRLTPGDEYDVDHLFPESYDSLVTSTISDAMGYARLISLLSALYYVAAMLAPKLSNLQFQWTQMVSRSINILIFVYMVIMYPLVIAGDDRPGGSSDWFSSTENDVLLQHIVSALYMITSAFMLLFYEDIDHARLINAFVLLNILSAANDNMIDDWTFSFSFALALNAWGTYLVGRVYYVVFKMNLLDIFDVVPGILYRGGNMVSILALMLLVSTYYNPWFRFSFTPSSISSDVAAHIDLVVQRIDRVEGTIKNVVTALDPCYVKNSPSTNADEDLSSEEALEARLADARKNMATNTQYGLDVCVYNQAPDYNFRDLSPGHDMHGTCESLKNDQERERENVEEELKYNDPPQTTKTAHYSEADMEDPGYVDQECRDLQCDVVTGVTLGALVLSGVPFMGTVGYLMGTVARAAFRIFSFGRKIAKIIPKILAARRRVIKMAQAILSVAVKTSKGLAFAKAYAVLFAPIILGFAVSAVLITIKRRAITRGEAMKTAVLVAVALSIPVVVSVGVMTLLLSAFPSIVQGLLDVLPAAFVEGEVKTLPGYLSLLTAYKWSLVGNIAVTASCVGTVFSSVLAFLTPKRRVDVAVDPEKADAFKDIVAKKSGASEANEANDEEANSGADSGANEIRVPSFKTRVLKKLRLAAEAGSDEEQRQLVEKVTRKPAWTGFNFSGLHALAFSLPIVYFLFYYSDGSYQYVSVYYKANSRLLSVQADIAESVAQHERTTAIGIETDGAGCGVTGRLIMEILNNVQIPGLPATGLSAIAAELNVFNGAFDGVFDNAAEFLDSIALVVTLPRIPVDFTFFPTEAFLMGFVFGIPVLCMCVAFLAWIVPAFVPAHVAGPSILMLASTNVAIHLTVSSFTTVLSALPMPFIELEISMEEMYYATIVASILNVVTAVAMYVNEVLP